MRRSCLLIISLNLLANPSLSFTFQSRCVSKTELHSQRLDEQHEVSNPPISRSSFLLGLAATPFVAKAESFDNRTSLDSKIVAFQESLSGFAAGGALTVTKTVVKYPLDTATVRLQMPGSDYSIWRPYRLFHNAYSGIIVPLLANIPAGSIFFAVKDTSKSILKEFGMGRFASTAISVAIAQLPYWAVRNPTEVVKTRQQARLPAYQNLSTIEAFDRVRQDAIIVSGNSTLGLEGFYSGYLENLLYAFPADVIKFLAYDFFTGGRKDLPPAQGALAGAAATAVAQGITTPLDVVRNRIMAEKNGRTGIEGQGYLETLKNLAQREGLPGLFAGTTPRISKAAISGAIQFATYEDTKRKVLGFLETRR